MRLKFNKNVGAISNFKRREKATNATVFCGNPHIQRADDSVAAMSLLQKAALRRALKRRKDWEVLFFINILKLANRTS